MLNRGSLHIVDAGHGRRPSVDDPRCPTEFGLAVGFFALFALTAVLAEARSSVSLDAATALEAGFVALLAWWIRPLAVLASAVLAWLFVTTFLVDRAETLRWHGSADLARLLALVATAAVGSVLRSGQLALRGLYFRAPVDWPDDDRDMADADDARPKPGAGW